MTAAAVVEVLDLLEAAGVQTWVDGGWGVDALLGEQTREHDDLDLAVDARLLERIQATLAPLGFRHAAAVEPGLPARFVLRDARERQIDVHPLVFDEEGNGWQDLGAGHRGRYPDAGLAGRGTIAGRAVRCLTPSLQLAFHAGPEPVERHPQDVALLSERFGSVN
jgi:lincosamide nucleotidyltransferase A/C/D/E